MSSFKVYTFLIVLMLIPACGEVSFSAKTDSAPAVDMSILLTNTNFYAEIGQEVPDEVNGDFELTFAQVFSEALFSGLNDLEIEVRVTFNGITAPGAVVVTGQIPPQGWSEGVMIFHQNINGGNTLNSLVSANIVSLVRDIIQQGQFWINIRARYAGLDIPQTATVQNTYVLIRGKKDLEAFSPLLNLSF